MKLQTTVNISPPKHLISHESKLLCIGSCFAENIGRLLQTHKFHTLLNPCGIAYNPASIATSIALVTGNKDLHERDFVFHNNLWHSLHHHGRFSNQEQQKLKSQIQEEIKAASQHLKNCSHIFLTLGTAWTFTHNETSQIVNNCHKLPAQYFERSKLSIEKIITSLQTAIRQIREQNKEAEIIFTVSPVRHIKDGLHENQLSKAALLLAIEELQKEDATLNYFPAYEIAIDELRDYRFYAEDYTHLNKLGTQYIWEKFIEIYMTKESKSLFPSILKLHKALSHKVQNANSPEHLQFIKKLSLQIENLEKKLPHIDFKEEKNHLQNV